MTSRPTDKESDPTSRGRITAANLPSWFEGYEQILPASLDDLKGPAGGFIDRPIRPFPFALDNWRMRVELYRELITAGHKAELERYINRDHFIELWPYIRICVCDGYRLPWERSFRSCGIGRRSMCGSTTSRLTSTFS